MKKRSSDLNERIEQALNAVVVVVVEQKAAQKTPQQKKAQKTQTNLKDTECTSVHKVSQMSAATVKRTTIACLSPLTCVLVEENLVPRNLW